MFSCIEPIECSFDVLVQCIHYNYSFCLFQEDHKYYKSEIIKDGQKYWVDVQGSDKKKVHVYLSDSYLLRQVSLHEIIVLFS